MTTSNVSARGGRSPAPALVVLSDAEMRMVEGGFFGLILGAIFAVVGLVLGPGLAGTADNPPTTVPTTGRC